jgi:hypothetical protein
MMDKNQKEAFKLATVRYDLSLKLEPHDPEKKSAEVICKEVNALKNTTVAHRTVRRYVSYGRVNVSPSKRGRVGTIPKGQWSSLKDAYATFIMLEQANKRDECTAKKLRSLVASCLQAGGYDLEMVEITSRLKAQTADLISAGKGNPQELRRLIWTTFQNLSTWFDTFHDIVV